MTRSDILAALKPLEPELKQLGFAKLYLFGSAGRGEPDPKDVDLLYEPEEAHQPGFDELSDAWERLEAALGKPVDLVARKNLHQRIRPRVEAEMIEVYR
jgi:predicted nucleotidyltransferase